jgi:hypothetical protein
VVVTYQERFIVDGAAVEPDIKIAYAKDQTVKICGFDTAVARMLAQEVSSHGNERSLAAAACRTGQPGYIKLVTDSNVTVQIA